MSLRIKTYIERLTTEVKSSLENDFSFHHESFKDFTSFDFINFYLINQYILNDEIEDFFISIPEDEYRPNFFASIFHSLVLIKLFQNYFYHTKHKPRLKINDLVYGKLSGKQRIFIIKGVGSETLKINLRFPKKNEYGAVDTWIPFKNQTKINPNLSNGSNTVKHIDAYQDFLHENFGQNFPFITEFQKRTLVIASKDFFNESKHLPIRYTNRNGNVSKDLPFFNYLIECCNDFKTAKKYLLDNDYTFDEVVVIGDTKYRECFYDILQECKWKGKAKNIIIIGSEEPSNEHIFKKWLWSNQEIRIANNENSKIILKDVIEFEDLYNELTNLTSHIDKYKDDFGINLYFILKYLNFFYKIIVVDSNISKGMYQEYADRLLHYFMSESFEEELSANFYNQDIYSPTQINECKQNIIDNYKNISDVLQDRNPKWEVILKKSKELKKFYLIVEKKSFDIMENQLRKYNINNIVLVSDKRIDAKKLYFDKCFNDDFNTDDKIFVLSYLNNSDLLSRLYELKGKAIVLCYKDIDEIAFDKLLKKKQEDESLRITHMDRNHFVKTEYSVEKEIIAVNTLNSLFGFESNLYNKFHSECDELEFPKDKIHYDIIFTDNSSDKFESTKGVFLVEDNEQIKTTIGEIYEGAKIRYYQNNNPIVFQKILKIFDTEGLLKSFDNYSESWKETLKKLQAKYGDVEILYSKLFDDTNKIHLNTFKNYFEENSSTRFPRTKVLNAIKNLCMSVGFQNELIVIDYEKFIIYSKRDHSIRQQAGRLLGNDLIDYIASNKTEKSESLLKLNEDIIDSLANTIVEKVIKLKNISNEE